MLKLCFLLLFTVVAANTEIVNFYASSDQRAVWNEWPTLSANGSEKQWKILPVPLGTPLTDNTSQLWINLDLSSKERTAYTLRVSWAAYYPTNVFIDVVDEPARAHIRFVDAGVFTPGRTKQPSPVPFSIVLERLYFGLLPASVLPTLVFMGPVLLMAGLAIPWINAYLEKVAVEARKERNV
ncbi:uncharacterized protein EV420DRAFT_1638258 [Desarmillaria tabescens]|uniref:Uncharacterized protein n=1 Tax=Armillaria tabescens TaxID=1929756 RepID=A0AA39NFJ8_ARMTA|nr:uncharacterized protein EV420DRAFT_1638258 [Desarmillaria tabescens]KAK0464716.1 hypothetical protein EV420DRAFT_1638258 [Desarmillaria tabescens]